DGFEDTCDVALVIGPTMPFSDDEALALQRFVQQGHGLLVAASSPPTGAPPPTGLEGVLAGEGLGLPPAIAVDPALAVRGLPGAVLVTSGYAAHPVNAGFAGDRATLWQRPRVVVVAGPARPLISATASSWGEHDFVSDVASKDPD